MSVREPGVRPVLTADNGLAHRQGHSGVTIIFVMLTILMITAVSPSPAPGSGGNALGFPGTGLAHRVPSHGLCAGTPGKTVMVIVTSAFRGLFPAGPGARRFKEK